MNTRLIVAIAVLALFAPMIQAAEQAPLTLARTLLLPDVEGRIDHLAIDLQGERLFIAALGNDTVEVLDLRTGSRVQSLKGFHAPQGIAFLTDVNRLAVTNGGNGTCELLDGHSFARLQTVSLGDDADNVRQDSAAQRLYVGYGNGAIGVVDPATGTLVGSIKLKAHPESLQLEPASSRLYVNVPEAQEIAVVDLAQQRVMAEWSTKAIARANFPMALDAGQHRLFVGFRQPAKLAVLDTTTGVVVATLDCVGDADEIFYDPPRKRLYIAGGAGALDVFTQINANTYQRLISMPTAPGSRTALFVPGRNQLFLAVPHRGSQHAEIRIYDIQP